MRGSALVCLAKGALSLVQNAGMSRRSVLTKGLIEEAVNRQVDYG